MENASKALIIAGAVLLAILLIAIGMLIFQGATGQVDQSLQQMSAQEVEGFNRLWNGFMGRPQRANQIESMVNSINVHNANNDAQITITHDQINNIDGVYRIEGGRLSGANTYMVTANFDSIGRINELVIE